MTWAKYQWDRVAAAVLAVIGLLALLLGYLGISGTVYPAEQLPYIISGGIIGIFCLGSAGVLYLSADMRDEWRKLDELDQTIKDAGLLFAASLDDARPAAPTQLRSVPQIDPPTAPIQVVAMEAPTDFTPAPAPRRTTRPRATQPAGAARTAGAAPAASKPSGTRTTARTASTAATRPARAKKTLTSEVLHSS